MKNIKYILFALVCILFSSCMGDSYADPNLDESPYGNNALTETNVITIAQLKAKYSSVISKSSTSESLRMTNIFSSPFRDCHVCS